MEQLLSVIAGSGNIAIVVLVVVLIGGWRTYREERRLEREARAQDASQCAASTDRQTEAVRLITQALADLRVELAAGRKAGP